MRRGAARTPGGGKTRTLDFGGAIGALRRPQGKLPRCSGGAPGCEGALKAFGRSAEADGALSSGREEGRVHRPARLLGVRDEERLLGAEQQARRRLPRRITVMRDEELSRKDLAYEGAERMSTTRDTPTQT